MDDKHPAIDPLCGAMRRLHDATDAMDHYPSARALHQQAGAFQEFSLVASGLVSVVLSGMAKGNQWYGLMAEYHDIVGSFFPDLRPRPFARALSAGARDLRAASDSYRTAAASFATANRREVGDDAPGEDDIGSATGQLLEAAGLVAPGTLNMFTMMPVLAGVAGSIHNASRLTITTSLMYGLGPLSGPKEDNGLLDQGIGEYDGAQALVGRTAESLSALPGLGMAALTELVRQLPEP